MPPITQCAEIFYNTAGKSAGKYYIGNFPNNKCLGIGYTAYRQDQMKELKDFVQEFALNVNEQQEKILELLNK